MAKYQFLNWENYVLKIQFHEKKIDLFDFMSFFAWTFLNFLAHCAMSTQVHKQLMWMAFYSLNTILHHLESSMYKNIW